MVKRLLTILMLGAGMLTANAQYQLANGDFEEWESVTYSGRTGDEPVKWSSFLDGTGNLKSMAGYNQLEKSNDKPTGSTGNYSAKLTSRAVKTGPITLAVAQGNLTTGCINMGSATAKDATGNYNYINEAEDREDQAMLFTGHPDAMKVWVKFKGSKKGNVNALLTTKGYYQDPLANEDKITATLIAKAQNASIASNDTWTEYTIPFEYKSEGEPYYALVSLSTCDEAGAGKEADYMFVDDIVMVYNSELKSATYNGASVSFTGTSATVNAEYNEDNLELTSNGVGATIERSYNEETALLTITVKGDNISEDANNKHVYTIQFVKPTTKPIVTDSKTYPEQLYVCVNGMYAEPQIADVVVELLDNGNINFVLKNFILGEGVDAMPIGNIFVENLEVNGDNKFVFNDNLLIQNGEDENIFWFGPFLGEMPLELNGSFTDTYDKVYVDIYIDLGDQVVQVHLGDDYVPATMAVSKAALYGTFCAPFEVKVPEDVVASTATLNGNIVELEPVEDDMIPANTPVILYAEDGFEAMNFYGKPVEGTPEAGVLTGVYELTVVPANSYLLQNQDGKVGFYNVGENENTLHVGANRCYLTADSGVKAYFFNEEADAINAVVAENGKEMFDLQGRKVMNAQKGIFIQNGKKVVK